MRSGRGGQRGSVAGPARELLDVALALAGGLNDSCCSCFNGPRSRKALFRSRAASLAPGPPGPARNVNPSQLAVRLISCPGQCRADALY